MHVIDVLQRLWLATLVSSAALLVVAALRVPWRRAFGAEYACRLWWLPPLALAACMIPHRAAVAPVARMPARILAMVSWRDTAPADSAAIVDWPAILLGLWIFGAICVLAIAILCQWRYARGLRRMPIAGIAPPPRVIAIVRARDGATGPALIGAWRPRIVLPNDFECRYDADERALILRHEGACAPPRWPGRRVRTLAAGRILVQPVGVVGRAAVAPRPGTRLRRRGVARATAGAARLCRRLVENPGACRSLARGQLLARPSHHGAHRHVENDFPRNHPSSLRQRRRRSAVSGRLCGRMGDGPEHAVSGSATTLHTDGCTWRRRVPDGRGDGVSTRSQR